MEKRLESNSFQSLHTSETKFSMFYIFVCLVLGAFKIKFFFRKKITRERDVYF